MRSALVCVDPLPSERDDCLQIAGFAVATMVSPDMRGRWQRVALLAAPSAVLEIVLAAWDVTDRATVEGGERHRSPLVVLPPLAARNDDFGMGDEELRPKHGEEPWSGSLADLERVGIIERAEGIATMPEPDDYRRFARAEQPAAVVREELARHGPTTILLLGSRPEIWAAMRGRTGILGFGFEGEIAARELGGAVELIDQRAEPPDLARLGEDLGATAGEPRQAALDGARLGARIAFVLERLYGPDG